MSEPTSYGALRKRWRPNMQTNKGNLLKVNVDLKELEESMRTSFESHSKHLFPSTGCGVWQYLHTGQLGNKSKQRDIDLGVKDLAKIDLAVKSETWYRSLKPVALFWSFELLHQLFIGMSHFLFRNEWTSVSPCSQETHERTDRGTD